MSPRRSLATLVAALSATVALAGCGGYQDDNDAAARLVAQTYLNALHSKDGAAACDLVAPAQQGLIAARANGDCPAGAKLLFRRREPGRTAGKTTVQLLGTPPTAQVDVPQYGSIGLMLFGSVWRIIASPDIHP